MNEGSELSRLWLLEKEAAMKRRKWNADTKALVVLESLKGRPVAELCTEHQISQSQYYAWRDQFLGNAAKALEVHQHSQREAHLQRENTRLKAPAVRSWLVWLDGGARAYLSSWPGENGVGMVEDLYTEQAYRHRGLATALLAHCVADARARGAGPVVIGADVNDTPKRMYAALGFRPLFVSRSYLRLLEPEGSS